VFIFFRDTNLTDTMFRLDEHFGWSLDSVTTDRVEDEVNAIVASAVSGPWSRVHRVVDRAYDTESNFGLLGFFKYFNLFIVNVDHALSAIGLSGNLPTLRVLRPVGISFYTFQAMSYTIDVYKGELRARRSLLDLAVFVSFFPHLVAGPIQRASFLLPQVEQPRRFSTSRAASGFGLICWGFFK
jgi:D-alanyl-lipoteichoic acid acyltransferase DltB (MBOAT superfamily)